MTEIKCLRCGQCCHFEVDGKLIKCPHLIKLSSGKTLCRIYNDKKRIGKCIYKKGKTMFLCTERTMNKANYPGCPYNRTE